MGYSEAQLRVRARDLPGGKPEQAFWFCPESGRFWRMDRPKPPAVIQRHLRAESGYTIFDVSRIPGSFDSDRGRIEVSAAPPPLTAPLIEPEGTAKDKAES